MAPPAKEVPIASSTDVVLARRAAREACNSLGFGLTDTTRVVTAVSELARNIYVHAGNGVMRWTILDDPPRRRRGIELVFADNGPGIEDPDRCMEEGYSTGGGLGMGLSGTRRLMDEMDVETCRGVGTTVTVRKWTRA